MAVEIVMPKQGNTVESCLIVEWKVALDGKVSKGDILCEVETDKSVIEVEAEQEGTVLALLFEEGDDVPVLAPMIILGEPGEDISSMIPKKQPEEGSQAEIAETPLKKEQSSPAETADAPRSFGRTAGDFTPASPRAKKTAAEKAVDIAPIAGSGPGGRVLESDVLTFAAAHPVVGRAARDAGVSAGAAGTGIGGRVRLGEEPLSGPIPGSITEVKPSGIRRVIASRMMESLQTTAQFTLNASAPAQSMMTWRKSFKNSDEKLGLRGITLGDMVVYAVSRLLPHYPELNGRFEEGVVYQYGDVHLGIAVDTPRGLMVPVIRNANTKNLKQISDETKALARACQEGDIRPDNLQGGTFTISNLGAFGIESFTPVINAPEIAILGVCNIQLKPVMKNDETLFEPYMGFSMTIDHQVVDGAPAAKFLKEFSQFLDSFELAAAF